MNKKTMLMTALLLASNTSFCMEREGEEDPTLSTPPLSPKLIALQKAQAKAQEDQLIQKNRQLLEELFPLTNNQDAPPVTPEPAPLANPNKAAGARKRITLLSIVQSAAYDYAPKPIQRMCDQAEEHPNIAALTALTAGECCGMCCCPNLTNALNLIGLGWSARLVYGEFMTKEKEL